MLSCPLVYCNLASWHLHRSPASRDDWCLPTYEEARCTSQPQGHLHRQTRKNEVLCTYTYNFLLDYSFVLIFIICFGYNMSVDRHTCVKFRRLFQSHATSSGDLTVGVTDLYLSPIGPEWSVLLNPSPGLYLLPSNPNLEGVDHPRWGRPDKQHSFSVFNRLFAAPVILQIKYTTGALVLWEVHFVTCAHWTAANRLYTFDCICERREVWMGIRSI